MPEKGKCREFDTDWSIDVQGGHSSGKPENIRELKSGQGKVRENELLQLFSCRDYCSDSNR